MKTPPRSDPLREGAARPKRVYNVLMDTFPTRVRVTASRVSDHVDDVRLRTGDAIAVGHRNQQYPEFVWCATEDGHHGWAPEECLEMRGPRSAVALSDYAAAHLTVSRGETLEALEQIGSWVFCRNASGRSGWVHIDALEEAGEDSGGVSTGDRPSRVRVVRSHITSDPHPVRFARGDILSIGHHDQQWRSYVWCTDQSGNAGWAPESYLEMSGAHEATGLRDYDATELTVGPGELLEVLEEAGGWLRCRSSGGHEGWIPGDVVEPA